MKHYVLALAILFSAGATAQNLETDRLALVKLFQTNGGGRWYRSDGWVVPGTTGDSPCGWYGVNCSGDRVTKIELPVNNLTGQLPAEIGNLTALTHLNLSAEGPELGCLRGHIPAEIGNLTNLEYLGLGGNLFDGENLAVLGTLTKLKTFGITPRWPIPNEFGNLVNLENLFLGDPDVFSVGNTDFPTFIFGLTKLKELYMSSFLRGVIPPEIGTLANLEVLYLSSNSRLTGSIPIEIGNLTKLKTLALNDCSLTGTIPSVIGNLKDLEELQLGSNNLSGQIPASFGSLSKLTSLGLSGAGLSGPVPDLSGIPTSAYVDLLGNRFTFAGLETNISVLDAYGTQAQIPVQGISQSSPSGLGVLLSVNAGGTLANNTYKWYKNESLVSTKTGNSEYFTSALGTYKCVVTNSIATQLTLTSVDYNLTQLPVTLVFFTSKKGSEGVLLTWKTSSERNNSGFEIERSADAKDFENIGFIDGNGDTKENKTYSFTDENPLSTTYYRLKQIDFDGKFEYSKIISVKQDQVEISLFPNPAMNQFFIKGLEKEGTMVIRNSTGYVLINQKINPAQPIATSKLANGIYLIQIGEEVRKLVIQK